MKFQYKIDSINKYIIETWPKTLRFEEYIEFKETEFNDPDFNPNYNIISDLRSLNMEFNEEMIDQIVKLIESYPDTIKKRKSAIITNSPEQVVNSFLFNSKMQNYPIAIKIFSTMESAVEWFLENDNIVNSTNPGQLFA